MRWASNATYSTASPPTGVPTENIECERDSFTFNVNDSPSAFVSLFRRYYGRTMNAFEPAEKSGTADALAAELENLFIAHHRSKLADFTSVSATFLRVTVTL